MTTRGTVRNRGISIAAAAVTAALVAPAISPIAPNALPAAHAQDAPTGDVTPPGADEGDDGSDAPVGDSEAPADLPKELHGQKVIWADAVENGYVKRVSNLQTYRNLLSGRAWEVTERGQVTGTGLPQVPAGTVVYMQWRDTDGSVSPYYAAHIGTGEGFRGPDAQGGPGLYAFDLREPWVDANGVSHQWQAKKGQEYRLWIPAYERDGVRYNMIRQANPLLPGGFTDGGANGATRYLNHNVQFTRILMAQAPKIDLMTRPRDEWVDGTLKGPDGKPGVIVGDEDEDANTEVRPGLLPGRDYKNTVSGTVWKETGNGRDKANMAIGPSYQKRHDFGVPGATVLFSKMTPEGYAKYDAAVNSLPETARTKAAEEFLAKNPDVIAYTYYAKTNENGQFTIQLPDGAIDKGVGKLDDIWMGVLDEEGNAVTNYSPWMVPQFHSPSVFTSMRPRDPGARMETTPVINIPTVVGDKLTSIAFALMPFYDAYIEVTNFDTEERPAMPGDKAELELNGTLLPLPNWIEWRGPDGKTLKGGPNDCMIVDNSLDGNPCATFEVPADAKPGTVYTAVLVNGDPEDRDEQNVFSADSFVVAAMQNAEFQPVYEPADVKQGEEKTIPAPVNEDPAKPLPDGTKFSAPENAEIVGPNGPVDEFPGDLTINPDGSITVKPKDDAPLGNYEVPVLATYPDGSKETVSVSIEVKEKDPGQAETTAPKWDETNVKPGEPKDVPNTGDPLPDGSKVEIGDLPEGWTAEVGPDGSTIKVTAPKDAKPDDQATIPVKVTYPDGTVDNEELKVTVQADYKAEYDPAQVKEDDAKTKFTGSATPKSTGEDEWPDTTTFAQGDKKETHDGLWDITDPDAKSGEVKAEVTWDKLKQRYEDERKNTLGGEECKPGESFDDAGAQALIEKLKPLFSAESSVNVTFVDDVKQDSVPVKFTLVDKNGKPLAESNDWDGDGVSNEQEIKDCKNPLDPDDQKPTLADETNPDWKDASTKPGEPVTVPNGGDKLPEDSTVKVPEEVDGWKVELDPDGETIKVTPPADANKDDKITVPVEVTYKDGSKDNDTFTVTIGEVEEKPNWEDKDTEPKKPVNIPNTGGPVKDGTTIEVDGPGRAELNPDGSITVTPNDDAKPGDKITVTVKDKDGNEIDKVTVTIGDADKKPDWEDKNTTPGTPIDIPNTGGPVKDGTTIEVDGPGTAELKPDGTITVTPSDDAQPGDKITVTVKDPDGEVIDTITVTIDPHPDWNDAKTPANKPVTIPKTTESGPVKPGTTVAVTNGPADATLNPDGSITVTPKPDAKKGDNVTVEVKDKNGNTIDTINVELTAPVREGSSLTDEERDRCIAVSVGFGLPLIALVPIGLALSASIPGLTPVVEQVSNQIQRANSELQRQLGVFNPEAARMSAQLDATLRQFGLSTAQVGSALAALIIGITAAASIASACTPGGGSSMDSIEGAAKGGSAQAGSSNRNNQKGSSVKNEHGKAVR